MSTESPHRMSSTYFSEKCSCRLGPAHAPASAISPSHVEPPFSGGSRVRTLHTLSNSKLSSAYSRRHDEGKPHIFVTLSAVITSPFYALFSSHAGYPNLSWYASSSM